MSKIEEIQKQRIINKISEDIRRYGLDMNINENKPMYPEEQISNVIDYLRGEGCISDIDVTCPNGNLTEDGILNVTLDVMLKPETIIRDINIK